MDRQQTQFGAGDRSPTSMRSYFPYIDGLRGLSIIAVILFHLDASLLPAGFGGVDVFFVISGFVVSASLHGFQFNRFRDFLVFFYARRVRRIIPGLAVMLVTTTLITALFVPRAYLSSHIPETALAAFLGFSNVSLALDSNGYFTPRAEYNPFTHTWSLGVEEQFYLVFPILYFAILQSRRAWLLGLIGFLFLSVCSLAYCLVEDSAMFKFYMIFGRFWELATGVGLYLVLQRRSRQPSQALSLDENKRLSYLGAALIGAGFIIGTPERFPFPDGLMPVIGTAFLILGQHGCRSDSWVARFLVARPIVLVGIMSYSLYLWHWPVFTLFRWTVGFETFELKIVALVVAVLLSVASYQLLERPFRMAGLLRTPMAAILGSLLLCAACAVGSQAIFRNEATISRSVVMQHQADWYPDLDFATQRIDGCRIERSLTAYSVGLISIVQPRSCGVEPEQHSLYVIGDSHAHAYWSMLGAYALSTGRQVVTYILPGCPSIEFMPVGDLCRKATADAFADLERRAKPGDIVFMSSLNLPRFRDQWHVERFDMSGGLRRQREAGLSQESLDRAVHVFRTLSDAGLTLIFELPKPIFPTPLFRCSDWFNSTNPSCAGGQVLSRALLEEYRRPVVQGAHRISSELASFNIWDPFPILCPNDPCRMTREGKPLYFDGDHLSGYGNRMLLSSFSDMIVTVRRKTHQE